MPTQLNQADHDAIQRRKKKHIKVYKKELNQKTKHPQAQNVLQEVFTKEFIISNLAMVVSWVGMEYLIRQLIKYVSTNPKVVMKILKTAGIWGVVAGVGLLSIVFIVKEYRFIKELEAKQKAGTLKDLEGKPIKSRKAFLEAVVLSTVGVKNVKVEKFVDKLLRV